MTETETRYDMMYAVTTDGCGTIYIEGADGVVLSSCNPGEDFGIEDDDEAIAGVVAEMIKDVVAHASGA